MNLNDQVKAYIAINSIDYVDGSYQTVSTSDGIESISFWDAEVLGEKPTLTQLASITSLPFALLIPKFQVVAKETLDSFAQSWGYDNIVSACSYANSTNEKFKAEALALISWRDAVWEVVANVGITTQTVEAFKALLPQSPARPIIGA